MILLSSDKLRSCIQPRAGEQIALFDLSDLPSQEEVKAARLILCDVDEISAKTLSEGPLAVLSQLCRDSFRSLYVVCGEFRAKSRELQKSFIREWCLRDELLSKGGGWSEPEPDVPQGYRYVAGTDEAGRGPLAGPVYAAAVILPEGFYHPLIKDSKKLNAEQREEARRIIEENAVAWGVASASPREIDEINILHASILSMHRALQKLETKPDFICVDGNRFKIFQGADGHVIPHATVVKGDAKISAISAASILAKTYRDEYMLRLAADYPQYGWERNMAYPTPEHLEAIKKYGLTDHHRRSFSCGVEETLL